MSAPEKGDVSRPHVPFRVMCNLGPEKKKKNGGGCLLLKSTGRTLQPSLSFQTRAAHSQPSGGENAFPRLFSQAKGNQASVVKKKCRLTFNKTINWYHVLSKLTFKCQQNASAFLEALIKRAIKYACFESPDKFINLEVVNGPWHWGFAFKPHR